MKKINHIFSTGFILILFLTSSCKKDLDHELDYNIFDSAYHGPEPVSIDSFIPVYSAAYNRNVLRIKLVYGTPTIKDAKVKLYKDDAFLLTVYSDTGTIATDYYTLAGQTHSYKVQLTAGDYKTRFSTPRSFTMY